MDMVLDYLFSMKWMSIIILIVFVKCFNKAIKTINKALDLKHMNYVKEAKYDEDEILGHLDFIIKQALDEYTLLHIKPKDIYYINSAMEDKIRDYIAETIPERISPVLLDKLGMLYNPSYVGRYIGLHIYFVVLEYVLDFNLEESKPKK